MWPGTKLGWVWLEHDKGHMGLRDLCKHARSRIQASSVSSQHQYEAEQMGATVTSICNPKPTTHMPRPVHM